MRAPRRSRRLAAWGIAAACVYVAAALLSFRAGLLPVRPLYDGTAPPQSYRWVKPPPRLAHNNQPPEPGSGTVRLGAEGSEASTIATGDGQVLVSFQEGSYRAKEGETSVTVEIRPIDPATLGDPPDGLFYDGNAYRISATYAPSGEPAEVATDSCPEEGQPPVCPVLILRYAFGAKGLYRLEGAAWAPVEARPVPKALQIFADVPRLGTFVAAGPVPPPSKERSKVPIYVAVFIGAAAVAAALGSSRRASVRRWIARRVERLRGKPPSDRAARTVRGRGDPGSPTPARRRRKRKR